jgi:hypothetical protein
MPSNIGPSERIFRDAIIAPAGAITRELMKNPEYHLSEWWLELQESDLPPQQYWFIGTKFAEHLKQLGHPVTTKFNSLAIWGRPTCGLGIGDDEVYLSFEEKELREYEDD